MADVEWAILCDYSFLDIGRKMCIIGVFNRIYTPNVPAQRPQSSMVVRFTGEPKETVKFKIEVIRPVPAGGGILAALAGEVNLSDTGAAEFSANIVGLPLPDYGNYAFQISIGTEIKKVVTFEVIQPPAKPKAE